MVKRIQCRVVHSVSLGGQSGCAGRPTADSEELSNGVESAEDGPCPAFGPYRYPNTLPRGLVIDFVA